MGHVGNLGISGVFLFRVHGWALSYGINPFLPLHEHRSSMVFDSLYIPYIECDTQWAYGHSIAFVSVINVFLFSFPLLILLSQFNQYILFYAGSKASHAWGNGDDPPLSK